MSNSDQWWVIAITSYGTQTSYNYFQGTQAQAVAQSQRYVEVSSKPSLSGPYATKAEAEAAVAGKSVNVPNNGPSPIPNPISGLSSAIDSALAGAIESLFGDAWNAFKDVWGFKSGKDAAIRIGFIILGFIVLIVGISEFTKGGSSSRPTGVSDSQQDESVLSDANAGIDSLSENLNPSDKASRTVNRAMGGTRAATSHRKNGTEPTVNGVTQGSGSITRKMGRTAESSLTKG
jgi:hypothetical protein